MTRGKDFFQSNLVPLLFLAVSAVGMIWAQLDPWSVSSDLAERVFRNMVLVLSLIIPIVAGLGLNFGIVLGAMAGQFGLMVVQNGRIEGLTGISVAVLTSIPVAVVLGILAGILFNKCRGREMITGIILSFFANGIYQLIFLILTGPLIPFHAEDMLLTAATEGTTGMGLKVTVDLTSVERGIDDGIVEAISVRIGNRWWGDIPILTLACIVTICLLLVWFFRTKLGQDLRAVGQDQHVAEIAGIQVNRCRIIAVIISMVIAGIGQIIFLQNMTVMNTYTSHEQVGFYAIAAILVGGATVTRVSIWNAIVGTIFFHLLIVVVSRAGQKIMGSAQIGEYLREFFTFAIIGIALVIHAWKSKTAAAAEDSGESAVASG